MSSSAATCSYCGKKRASLKRCSVCKQASYCGAECQNAAWKGHKKTCVAIQDVWNKVRAARAAINWQEVLKWEERMEELMEQQPDAFCKLTLETFTQAHKSAFLSRGTDGQLSATCLKRTDHIHSAIRLEERQIKLLGKMERFRDQGEIMCNLASENCLVDKRHEGVKWYQEARDVGAAHGFFVLESAACRGLGRMAIDDGRREEGVDLLRNALIALPLSEREVGRFEEIHVIDELLDALFISDTIDGDEVRSLSKPLTPNSKP